MSSLSEHLRGREYWRSLEHLAGTPEVQAQLESEFPGYDPEEMKNGISRRSFLGLMSAALGLAGLTLTGCRRWPVEQLRPFAYRPPGIMPGVPLHYATIMEMGGVATGLVVKSYDGRPIKVEGNTLHPYSLGAAGPWEQASVLSLYDPDRARTPVEQDASGRRGDRTWEQLERMVRQEFGALKADGGQGLVVLSEALGGPTAQRLKEAFLQQFPKARWLVYEPLHRDQEIEGSRQAFGQALRPQYHLDRAKVVACFDADLVGLHPARLRHARQWSAGRRAADEGWMNRLYAVETDLTITGAAADYRLAVAPSRVPMVLGAVAGRLGLAVEHAALTAEESQFADQIAADLKAQRGTSLVAVGLAQPPQVHALGHAVNQALGNLGQTVSFTQEPLAQEISSAQAIAQINQAAAAGEVKTLLILGGNPVYDGGLSFKRGPGGVATSIHLSNSFCETSAACDWHLPQAQYLESWGDGRAWDGTLSVQQPLILPLFDAKSTIELLALLLDVPKRDGLALVQETFRGLLNPLDFQAAWQQVLDAGLVKDSAWPPVQPDTSALGAAKQWKIAAPAGGLELLFVTDASMYDGRWSNNGWLQEMPDPITKVVWDNPARISKALADRLGVTDGDVVSLTTAQGRKLDLAVSILPGAADGAVIVPLGYGRKLCGRIGIRVGFDSYVLRPASLAYLTALAAITPTGRTYPLSSTQVHQLIDAIGMAGRAQRIGQPDQSGMLIHEATLGEYRRDPEVFRRREDGSLALPLYSLPKKFNHPHAWGMAIDLNSCIGCNACLVACQAENNVPIVGKDQVARNREMHWLRVDRYFRGDIARPETVFTPLACVHCESAPCEEVCPVGATSHDSEGLNVMVYNRCIGTRYCSNNCPYKVRRFNFFDWNARNPRTVGDTPPFLGIPDQQQSTIDKIREMVFNPDVTVRMRGVMEKCSYCLQRIKAAEEHAQIQFANGLRDSELVRDGEMITACQESCPTQAIVFGNLNDPHSRVSRMHENNRAYAMLGDLGIGPRTHHLARIRNVANGSGAQARADRATAPASPRLQSGQEVEA